MANKYNRITPTKGLLRSSTPDESELNSMLPGNNDNDRYVPRIQRDKPVLLIILNKYFVLLFLCFLF